MSDYEVVIGLEVHVQLATNSKLFCGCATGFGADANSQVCPVCTGQPGALPVLNQQVVESAVRMGLALGCEINLCSRFARKNYFYPDMPKGYQISQYDQPIAEHGRLDLVCEDDPLTVGITRIHLEDDAGKTIHGATAGFSHVDLNRSGMPLIEVVSEPELRSPAGANAYMRAMRGIVRALGISDGNMEEGSLRCDANISLRPRGATVLGTKAEIKNVNSFRFVQRALEYEIDRQREVLIRGDKVVQETRLFDAERGVTRSMRSKEEAHDYRYFPEPDLPPLRLEPTWVEALRRELPELPLKRRERFVTELKLTGQDADALTKEPTLANYFEETVAAGAAPKAAANWILTELLSRVADPRSVAQAPVSPQNVADLLKLVAEGRLSGKLAKQIWPKMWDSSRSAMEIAEAEDLFQQSDEGEIARQIHEILAANTAKVAEYKAGKEKLFGFFVGQVMKATQGKANPQLVNQLLKRLLAS